MKCIGRRSINHSNLNRPRIAQITNRLVTSMDSKRELDLFKLTKRKKTTFMLIGEDGCNPT